MLKFISMSRFIYVYTLCINQHNQPHNKSWPHSEGVPGSWAGKESACNAGDSSLIPGLGRSTGEGIGYPLQYSWASLVTQLVKKFTRNVGVLGSIPGLGRSPGEGNGYPLWYSDLENSMDYTESDTTFTFTFHLTVNNFSFIFFCVLADI